MAEENPGKLQFILNMSQIHTAVCYASYSCRLLPGYCLAHLGVMNSHQCVEWSSDMYKSISWQKLQNNEGPKASQLKSPGCLSTSFKMTDH